MIFMMLTVSSYFFKFLIEKKVIGMFQAKTEENFLYNKIFNLNFEAHV